MAFALSAKPSVAIWSPLSSPGERVFSNHLRFSNFFLLRRVARPSPLSMARRRSKDTSTNGSVSSKRKKATKAKENVGNRRDDGMKENSAEDPLEALFSLLEKDLEKDVSTTEVEYDSDINEEDIDRLATELGGLLGDFDMSEFRLTTDDAAIDTDDADVAADGDDEEDDDYDDEDEDDDDDDEDDDEEIPLELKNWQLRKLAYALRVGRRKTNIKTLAADLCLERYVVLELLRDPPPNLLLMSATLPDESTPTLSTSETEQIERENTVDKPQEYTKEIDVEKPQEYTKEPIHNMQHKWSTQKRLKKAQLHTLESVYRRSKRPTDAMISSMVHVTNLPRKRILKWFEDKRNEKGVPKNRQPYQPSTPKTTFSH